MCVFTHPDGREECHPLFNQTIFENILAHLSVEELKPVRLTCKEWSRSATPALQDRAWVNMGTLLYDWFLAFLDFVPQTPFRYQNFKFSSSSWLWKQENLDKFVGLCVPHMKSLNLTHVVLNYKHFRKILFSPASSLERLTFESSYFYKREATEAEGTHNAGAHDDSSLVLPCPRLKSFTYINTDEDSDFTNMNLLPCTWDELFGCFPSLSELKLVDLTEEKVHVCLTSLLRNKSRMNIKALNIFGQTEYATQMIEADEWKLLHSLSLQLNTLEIDVGQIVNEEGLRALLWQQAPTLRTLKIWRGVLAPDLDGFPYGVTLPTLRTLELPDNLVTSLRFLNYLPRLSRLWIRVCDTSPFEDFTTLLEDAANVRVHEALRIFQIDSYLTVTDIAKLYRLFPRLACLKYFKQFA